MLIWLQLGDVTHAQSILRRTKMRNVWRMRTDRMHTHTHTKSRMWVEKCLMTVGEVHGGLAAAQGRKQQRSTFHAVHFINEQHTSGGQDRVYLLGGVKGGWWGWWRA